MHKSDGEPQPCLHRASGQRRGIDVDVAVHRSAFHDHGTRSRSRKRFALAVLTDARKQAALGRRDNQVAVQHEAEAAEHLHFTDRAFARKRGAYAFGKLLVSQHVNALTIGATLWSSLSQHGSVVANRSEQCAPGLEPGAVLSNTLQISCGYEKRGFRWIFHSVQFRRSQFRFAGGDLSES